MCVCAHCIQSICASNCTVLRALTLKVLVATTDAQWELMGDVGSARYELALCRVGEVRAGTTSPMPDHKGFKLQ